MKVLTRLVRIAALTLAAFCALPGIGALAQTTTYTLSAPVTCAAASTYPVTSPSQFSCTGLFYDGQTVEVYFNAGNSAFELFGPNGGTITEYESSMRLTQFTQPSATAPGSFSFNWSGTDQGGVFHTGSWSG